MVSCAISYCTPHCYSCWKVVSAAEQPLGAYPTRIKRDGRRRHLVRLRALCSRAFRLRLLFVLESPLHLSGLYLDVREQRRSLGQLQALPSGSSPGAAGAPVLVSQYAAGAAAPLVSTPTLPLQLLDVLRVSVLSRRGFRGCNPGRGRLEMQKLPLGCCAAARAARAFQSRAAR